MVTPVWSGSHSVAFRPWAGIALPVSARMVHPFGRKPRFFLFRWWKELLKSFLTSLCFFSFGVVRCTFVWLPLQSLTAFSVPRRSPHWFFIPLHLRSSSYLCPHVFAVVRAVVNTTNPSKPVVGISPLRLPPHAALTGAFRYVNGSLFEHEARSV